MTQNALKKQFTYELQNDMIMQKDGKKRIKLEILYKMAIYVKFYPKI